MPNDPHNDQIIKPSLNAFLSQMTSICCTITVILNSWFAHVLKHGSEVEASSKQIHWTKIYMNGFQENF